MAHYNVTLSIAHDPLTWRETRHYENFEFTFKTFAEIQAFAKEKFEDKTLPHSGGHCIFITPVADDGTTRPMGSHKYANWPALASGDYSHMDKALHNN